MKKSIKNGADFILKVNRQTYLEQYLIILNEVKIALESSSPMTGICPCCDQPLPNTMESIYEYYQNVDDIDSRIEKVTNELKDLAIYFNNINQSMKINQIIQVLIPGILASISFFNLFSGNHLEAIFWLILTIHISNQL